MRDDMLSGCIVGVLKDVKRIAMTVKVAIKEHVVADSIAIGIIL